MTTSVAPGGLRDGRLVAGLWRNWAQVAGVLVVVGFAVSTRGFFQVANLRSVAFQASIVGILAVGMTFITLSGNFISLSMGATATLVGIVFFRVLDIGGGPSVALALAVAIGAALVQGAVVAYVDADPLIVSLGAASCLLAISTAITGGHSVRPSANDFIGSGNVGGLQASVWVLLGVTVVGELFLRRTRMGREIKLVGSNRRAARLLSVRSELASLIAYALMGVCMGVAGILLASQQGTVNLTLGSGFDLPAIAVVIVGGTSLTGGKGSVTRSLLASVFIASVENIAALRGFSVYAGEVVTGIVVFLGIVLVSRSR